MFKALLLQSFAAQVRIHNLLLLEMTRFESFEEKQTGICNAECWLITKTLYMLSYWYYFSGSSVQENRIVHV